MAARLNVQDAMSAIRGVAPASKNKYAAVLAADGSITISMNPGGTGVFTALPNKFWWNIGGVGPGRTDADSTGDTITVEDSDGSNSRTGGFQNFLSSLT